MRIMVVFSKTYSFSPTDQISLELVTSPAFKDDELFVVARGSSVLQNDNIHFCPVQSFASYSIKTILSSKISFWKKMLYCFQRIISKFAVLLLGYDARMVSCYKKTLNRVVDSYKFDAIISISGCYECNVAACSIAHKHKIKLFPYLCDPYPFVKKRQFMRTFKKIIRESRRIFAPLEYCNDYFNEFLEYKQKIEGLAFPCLFQKEIIKSTPKKNKNDKIVISYFGSLGFDGRDLNELSMVFGNCENILLDLYTSSEDSINKKNIRFNGMVSKDEMIKRMMDSNFLLVFDNDSKMLPSKCVRYVSTTLPIIVLTARKESSVRLFLSKYKNYYIHYLGSSTDGLYKYIENTIKSPFKFDDSVYDSYIEYLPDNVFKKIRKNIN